MRCVSWLRVESLIMLCLMRNVVLFLNKGDLMDLCFGMCGFLRNCYCIGWLLIVVVILSVWKVLSLIVRVNEFGFFLFGGKVNVR